MPIFDSANASPGIVYKTATYTAKDGDFVVATSGSFTVTLPPTAPTYGPATQATVVGTTGPQAPKAPVSQGYRVTVRNIGSGTVTVKTADGSTIDGIVGATGAVLAQYEGVALVTDTAGLWVCSEGTHT